MTVLWFSHFMCLQTLIRKFKKHMNVISVSVIHTGTCELCNTCISPPSQFTNHVHGSPRFIFPQPQRRGVSPQAARRSLSEMGWGTWESGSPPPSGLEVETRTRDPGFQPRIHPIGFSGMSVVVKIQFPPICWESLSAKYSAPTKWLY